MPISPLDFSAHVRAYRLHAGTREIMARTWAAIEASRRLLQEPVVPLQFLPPPFKGPSQVRPLAHIQR